MYSYVDLTAMIINCCTNDSTYKLYRPKLVQFSDNVIMFAVNGLLYPYFM